MRSTRATYRPGTPWRLPTVEAALIYAGFGGAMTPSAMQPTEATGMDVPAAKIVRAMEGFVAILLTASHKPYRARTRGGSNFPR